MQTSGEIVTEKGRHMDERDIWSWRQEQELKAQRRWRAKWLIVIGLGMLVLISLCLFVPSY
jgi:hypothetical protein